MLGWGGGGDNSDGALHIKFNALYRCSNGGEPRDSSHYERENAQMVIGSNPLRRHFGYDDSHDGALFAATTGRIELSSTAALPKAPP
jgi:hypothetical protein